jgi:hypothetical protein
VRVDILEVSESDNLGKIVTAIEQALRMHTRWHENLIRLLICKRPLPDSVIEAEAHKCCEFGKWFYGKANLHLHQLPLFRKINDLHRLMHASTRDSCLKYRTMGMMTEDDYDHLLDSIANFRKELTSLKARAESTLSHTSVDLGET